MLEISSNLADVKAELLAYYRNRASESLQEVCRTYAASQFRKRAAAINQSLVATRQQLVMATLHKADAGSWTPQHKLQTLLMLTYTNYIVMLESRNAMWPYEYMAFSRRIGELWEPFCKLCFDYPITELDYFVPPLFSEVQKQLRLEITDYINALTVGAKQKKELLHYYERVWSLVTSGEIKLELDLHFLRDSTRYNIDFKSGFGSNEKGNTNRLLLVATVYRNLEHNYRCVLLVRSAEDQNNHYFQTLKKSSVWDAYCGLEAYQKICEFTGFDISRWTAQHIDWASDLNNETRAHFQKEGLEQYLSW